MWIVDPTRVRGPLSISVPPPYKFSVFRTAVMDRFGLAPLAMDSLKLRRVGVEPTAMLAPRLFGEAADRAITSTAELTAGDVEYIVGEIEAPGGGWFQLLARRRSWPHRRRILPTHKPVRPRQAFPPPPLRTVFRFAGGEGAAASGAGGELPPGVRAQWVN